MGEPCCQVQPYSVGRAWPGLESVGFSLGPGLAPTLPWSCSPRLPVMGGSLMEGSGSGEHLRPPSCPKCLLNTCYY